MVKIVAHRGFSGKYPENTEIAFLKALSFGVDMIEFDVHQARNNELIIIHDSTVDRTSNGSGKIEEKTLSEIKALDAGSWFGEEFNKERFLTLKEALNIIGDKVRLNIHIKAYENNRQRIVTLSLKEIEQQKLLHKVFIASDEETIKLVKQFQPKMEICNLSVTPESNYITRSFSIKCRILQPGNGQVNPEFVKEAHSKGMEVNPFYADEMDEMSRLIKCGVDGILTNFPDRLRYVQKNK